MSTWPQVADSPSPVWRPAPYAIELHLLGSGQALNFGGEPIAATRCGRSAMVDEQARGGPVHWQGQPRCPGCGRQDDARQ